MADLDNATKTAILNVIESTWGSGVYAKVFAGASKPADVTDPDAGSDISGALTPAGGANWLSAPSNGVATTAAVDYTVLSPGGTPTYVRWYDSSNVCRRQIAVGVGAINVTPAGALTVGAPARLGSVNFRVPV